MKYPAYVPKMFYIEFSLMFTFAEHADGVAAYYLTPTNHTYTTKFRIVV